MQEIFKLDCFFIENYYKMCVTIIMADPVYSTGYRIIAIGVFAVFLGGLSSSAAS